MGHNHHLLPIVVSIVAVVALFLWLSAEHSHAQRILYSHWVEQGRIRLSSNKHEYLYYQRNDYCDSTFKVISSLKNGVVNVDKTDVDCFGRCIEASKEYREANVLKPWEDVEDTVFTCETVEVVCLAKDDPERVEYRMLHRQFLNVRDFTRFLPKTVDYLEETMSEITGIDNNGNELGQKPLLYEIFTGLLNKNERKKELCTMFLGNETTRTEGIFQGATKDDYVTMFNDDSSRGIFNILRCSQGKENLVDHSLEHFYTYTWSNWFIKYIFHGKGCQFTYRNTLDLIRNVWQTYPDRPIFSLNLISTISKNWLVPIFDQDLKTFLLGLPPGETIIILASLSNESEKEFRIFRM